MHTAATTPDATTPKVEDAFDALRALAGSEVRVLYSDPDSYQTRSITYGVLDASSEFSDGDGGHYFGVYDEGRVVGSFVIDPASLHRAKCWVREDRQAVEFFSNSVFVCVELFD